MKPLPENSVFSIPADVAGDLLKATQRLPEYSAHEYYDPEIQQHVYDVIRQACSDEFDELILKMKLQIKKPPFSLLIKGLVFDSHHRLLVALNRAFGLLVARPHEKNTPRAQLIHQIVPGTDKDEGRAGNARAAKVSEKFHVDGADRPSGLQYVSMQCVHAHEDHSQGRSRLLDSGGFRAILQDGAINQGVINLLETQRVPWKTPAYLGGGVSWAPVLRGDCIRWNRDIINGALKEKNISISSSMMDTLDHIDTLLDTRLTQQNPHIFDFRLEPGDFLMMDNRRCLHTRSPINNPDSTRRLMLRAWVE